MLVEDWCAEVDDPSVRTVLVAEAVFEAKLLAALEGVVVVEKHTVAIVWMYVSGPPVAEGLQRPSGELQPPLVEVDALTIGARTSGQDWEAVRECFPPPAAAGGKLVLRNGEVCEHDTLAGAR
jgi:hypothetical protein